MTGRDQRATRAGGGPDPSAGEGLAGDEGVPASCEVVIIGAGVGGLTAAGLLAAAGLEVVLFEAEPRLGGYLAGFQRRGFHFDSSVQWLNQCGPGGFVRDLWSSFGEELPALSSLSRIHRSLSEDHDYLLTDEPDLLRDELIADFPAEASGIRAFFDEARRVGRWLTGMNRRVRAPETMAPLERATYGLRAAALALPSLRHLQGSVDKSLGRYFARGGAARLFSHQESFMSVIVPIGWAYERNWQMLPPGGSQALASWLAGQARRQGAQIYPGRAVRQVLLDGGRAAGVTLEDGRTTRCRFVIAACDAQALFDDLLPPARRTTSRGSRLRGADLYYSSVTVYLGLDRSPSELGLGEEHITITRSDVRRGEHGSGNPHRTLIDVQAPSLRDPTLAPAGSGTITLQCPAFFEHEGHWRTGPGLRRGEAYRALKRAFAEVLLDRVERALIPGLRRHIQVMEVATPITYQRYTRNTRGTIMGVRPTARNIRAGVAGYRTPVEGLLIGGHCAEYGGGVPMAVKAGANASLLVLGALAPRAQERLKVIMDGRDPVG